jgi:predicted transcriptional regulator
MAFLDALTVQNGTARIPFRCHVRRMRLKNRKKALENATRKSVEKEMAKPRISKSARITELDSITSALKGVLMSRLPSRRKTHQSVSSVLAALKSDLLNLS